MDSSELEITKLDAAKRQLESAILLYFNYGDPVSIHTLCAAAYNVLRDINEKRSGKRMLKDLWQLLDTNEAKEFKQHINRAENFFKHADRDPDALCALDPEWTQALLCEASQKYLQLTGEHPPFLISFVCWFFVRHPNVFHKVPEVDGVLQNLQGNSFPEDRREFLKDFLLYATRFVGV